MSDRDNDDLARALAGLAAGDHVDPDEHAGDGDEAAGNIEGFGQPHDGGHMDLFPDQVPPAPEAPVVAPAPAARPRPPAAAAPSRPATAAGAARPPTAAAARPAAPAASSSVARPAASASTRPAAPANSRPAGPARPAAPSARPSAPTAAAASARPSRPIAPPSPTAPARPSAPVRSAGPQRPAAPGQPPAPSQDFNVVEGEPLEEDVMLAVPSAPMESLAQIQHAAPSASRRAIGMQTLKARQTAVPILLTTGFFAFVAGVLKYVVGDDSPMHNLPLWIESLLFVFGLIVIAVAVINMISIRAALAAGQDVR